MSNIVIFGPTQSGKSTLMGFLATAMLRNPQFNEEVLEKLKLIKKLTVDDIFRIGNPNNPVNVRKDVILPSFVSLDRDELRKFAESQETSEGTTKRLHRKMLTICMAQDSCGSNLTNQYTNDNMDCTFVDVPGFRQRLSDKYQSFFEGDIGIAVLKIKDVLSLYDLFVRELSDLNDEEIRKMDSLERSLFEPLRIWCDYRSPKSLVIALSQIDQDAPSEASEQIARINNAIFFIKMYTDRFNRGHAIPISPISIKVVSERNVKEHSRMQVFFKRRAENIYLDNTNIPGDGSLISCLKQIVQRCGDENYAASFIMASVYKAMKATVNHKEKTALNILSLHGTLNHEDSVMLGPVIDKKSGKVFNANCMISSIKADGAVETSKQLLQGSVGGVIFKRIEDADGKEYRLDYKSAHGDIKLTKSTVLFSGSVVTGDILELEIRKDEYITVTGHVDEIYDTIIPALLPFEKCPLYWYGKRITVNFIEMEILEDKICLSAILSEEEKRKTPLFMLPCNEQSKILFMDNVIFAVPESYYSSRKHTDGIVPLTYISASVTGIKRSQEYDSVSIHTETDWGLAQLLEGHVYATQQSYDNADAVETCIPLMRAHRRLSVYSTLKLVKNAIRKSYGRAVYRQLGRVTLKLKTTSDNHVD